MIVVLVAAEGVDDVSAIIAPTPSAYHNAIRYRHGAKWWSWEWQILTRQFYRQRRTWLDEICMDPFLSIFLTSDSGLFDLCGKLVFRESICSILSSVACQARSWTIALFFDHMYEFILRQMDPGYPLIGIPFNTYSSHTLSHRSVLIHTVSAYSVSDIFNSCIRRIIWRASRQLHHFWRTSLAKIVSNFAVESDLTLQWRFRDSDYRAMLALRAVLAGCLTKRDNNSKVASSCTLFG